MNERLVRLLTTTAITGFVAFGMSGCFLGNEEHSDVAYRVTEPVHTLVIEGRTGDIRVVGAGTDVHVTEHQAFRDTAPAATHTTVDGTLTLTYTCPDGDCGVGYDVDVPAGTAVRVKISTGSVHLSGLTADVQAATSTGQIDAVRLGSPTAALSSDTGDVSAAFTSTPGSVRARTSTGDVKVVVPAGTGYAVAASADTGRVKVTVPQEAGSPRTILAKASTGDVTVDRA